MTDQPEFPGLSADPADPRDALSPGRREAVQRVLLALAEGIPDDGPRIAITEPVTRAAWPGRRIHRVMIGFTAAALIAGLVVGLVVVLAGAGSDRRSGSPSGALDLAGTSWTLLRADNQVDVMTGAAFGSEGTVPTLRFLTRTTLLVFDGVNTFRETYRLTGTALSTTLTGGTNHRITDAETANLNAGLSALILSARKQRPDVSAAVDPDTRELTLAIGSDLLWFAPVGTATPSDFPTPPSYRPPKPVVTSCGSGAYRATTVSAELLLASCAADLEPYAVKISLHVGEPVLFGFDDGVNGYLTTTTPNILAVAGPAVIATHPGTATVVLHAGCFTFGTREDRCPLASITVGP